MARRHHRRKSHRASRMKAILSAAAVFLILLASVYIAQMAESRMAVKVENAGKQMTAHTSEDTAQVFMNGQWHEKKNVETLLVMGIDDKGAIAGRDSYNTTSQADFLVLYMQDKDSGETAAIHLNRDTMTDITMLGITGQAAGTRHAQLALAYTYGRGEEDSSRNTAEAVSHLLYGMSVDHYIAVTMDAVPIMNDWVDGVEVEIFDDFSGISDGLVMGEKVTLTGEQAMTYIQARHGLDDSTNLNRMARQRQYASAWMKKAQAYLDDTSAVADLMMRIEDYHYSDCTVEELTEFARRMSQNSDIKIYELAGEAVKGDAYMEYHADDEKIQQLVLELFFRPVN